MCTAVVGTAVGTIFLLYDEFVLSYLLSTIPGLVYGYPGISTEGEGSPDGGFSYG